MSYIVPSDVIIGKGTEKTAYACKISESKEGAKVAFDSKYIRDIEGEVNSICILEVKTPIYRRIMRAKVGSLCALSQVIKCAKV
jgi:hypothetical protein